MSVVNRTNHGVDNPFETEQIQQGLGRVHPWLSTVEFRFGLRRPIRSSELRGGRCTRSVRSEYEGKRVGAGASQLTHPPGRMVSRPGAARKRTAFHQDAAYCPLQIHPAVRAGT